MNNNLIHLDKFVSHNERLYSAFGKVNEKEFNAISVVYQGKISFKILEEGTLKPLKDSDFSLSERMSVSHFLSNYAKGKIDKLGRKIYSSPGVGIVIKQQREIDELKQYIESLETLLVKSNIVLPEKECHKNMRI